MQQIIKLFILRENTSIFALIKRNFKSLKQMFKRILNMNKNWLNEPFFFFLAGKRNLSSFQQLPFWHLIESFRQLR